MIPLVLSVVALCGLVGVGLALGKRMSPDEATLPVFAGILGSVVVGVVYFPVNVLIDIDGLEFAPVLILIEFLSLPLVAAVVVWISSTGRCRGRKVAAAVVPVVLLVLVLNPFSEFLLACVFGRSIYMTQFFGFAGCG